MDIGKCNVGSEHHNSAYIAGNLRLLRNINGYRQEDVAATLNISRSSYCCMEKGLRIPDIMMLYGISRLYGVHMDALISLDIREHLMSSIRGCSEKTAIFDFSLTLHHPDPAVLRENLCFLRILHGMSQESLARRLHLSRSTYSAYESGNMIPDVYTLSALASLYGITPEIMLTHDLPAEIKNKRP